ncbi:hypothetical protein ABW21_db0208080 [Orbilia brochopaga]|nr:hypothetical protein ABW21_db0208080 [Drechslerella brochopaga]
MYSSYVGITAVVGSLAVASSLAAAAVSPRSEYTYGPFTTCSDSDKALTSCTNKSKWVQDSCCVETHGRILATQFWDAKESDVLWTVHGLWPHRCDGVQYEHCDASRFLTADQITSIIKQFNGHDLLSYMRRNWKDHNSVNGSLWAHEYNKHATCSSSGRPQCYSDFVPDGDPNDYATRKEVMDYFYRTTEIYKTLDTYVALEEAGIVPSESQVYTVDEVQTALRDRFGVTPTVVCLEKTNELSEVWYHFHVKGGNIYEGELLPIGEFDML